MCGITGTIDTHAQRAIAHPVLRRIDELQAHRVPDEGSLYLKLGVGLGHRRLLIIDVAAGQQAPLNEDRSEVIVLNGEIYNSQQLIPKLQTLANRFRTKSDTEIIEHAREAWGADCVRCLRDTVHVTDQTADMKEAAHDYGARFERYDELPWAEAIIAAVAYRNIRRWLRWC
jgi:asparagine synthase (glutamine-hydrolysing)